MGYGFMAWSVDIDVFVSLFNSRKTILLEKVADLVQEEFSVLDEDFEAEIEEGCPTAREALLKLAIINSKPSLLRLFLDKCKLYPLKKKDVTLTPYGFMYAYAVEKTVSRIGTCLDNSMLYPLSSDYIEKADIALSEMGVTEVSFSKLMNGQLPIEIPTPDDFPAIGYLSYQDVLKAKSEFATNAYNGSDEDIREVLQALREWLDIAYRTKHGIICFYY